MKRTGDNAEPWGKPYSEHCLSLPTFPFIFSLTFRVKRKLFIRLATFPVTPSWFILIRSPFFQTLSNAFSKSTKRHSIDRFSSLSARIPKWSLFRYLIVFLDSEKPSWWASVWLLSFRYSSILLAIIASKSLPIYEVISAFRKVEPFCIFFRKPL